MRSFFQKALIFAVLMTLVAGGGWLGRKAYRRATQRNLLTEAGNYISQKDYRNAGLCLQRALQMNRSSIDASKMMADLMDAVDAPTALEWRAAVVRMQPDNVTNRFALVQTAIKLKDYRSAAAVLRDMDEKARETAGYHKLLGALAWNERQAEAAETNYAEAYRLEPTNQTIALNLATIRLASTNRDVAAAARLVFEGVPTNSPLRSMATHQLLSDAIARKRLSEALGYSDEIIEAPSANLTDKIQHLELLRIAGNAGYLPWLASLKDEARHSPYTAYGLGRWMLTADGATNTLGWLHALPSEMQTNQPVPLITGDCLMMMKDWKGLLALTEQQDWEEIDYYRFTLESLAERSLGRTVAAEGSWRKALHASSHQLNRLTSLTGLTVRLGWSAERMEVLQEVMDEFPKETWPVDQMAGALYAEGRTSDLEKFFAKLYEKDTNNVRLKNNVANLNLLLKSDLENSHRQAREVYEAATNDPSFASTYAYSLFLQNRTDEALKVLNSLKPGYFRIPSIAVYYGYIQAQAGHKDLARAPLETAATAKLLPEEMEMIRSAKTLL